MHVTPRVGSVVLAALVALATPGLAGASARVVLGPIRGDRGGALSRQIAKKVCARLECAPKASAYAGTRPDFARARRQGVSGILYGAVTGSGRRRMLWLALLTDSTEPARSWKVPLRPTGLLAPAALDAIVDEATDQLAPPPARPRVAAPPAVERAPAAAERGPAPEPPVAAPSPAPAPPPPPPPERVAAASPRPVIPAPRPPPPARGAAEPSRERPPWLAVELGGYVTGRELAFSGTQPAGTSPLQTMTADAVFCPRAALELYPAALVTPGALAGLGVFADYRTSVGFKVKSGTQTYGTTLSRLGAGVVWRSPPLTSLKLELAPAVSWEKRDVKVNGTIPGLADTHLQGLRAGASLSVPFASRFAFVLGGGYVRWTKAGDLARSGGSFFPSGTAAALEAEAGLSMRLYGPFSARLVAEYSATSYDLDADPTGTYRATGATDRWAGGMLSVRAEL